MTNSVTDALVTDEVTANRLFREYTRSSAFRLNLGIQEIRMIKHGWYTNAWSFNPQEMAVMKRLMDKGLLIHEREGESPKLTQTGRLVRILLSMSGHIVCPQPKHPVSGRSMDWSQEEVLNEIHHAFDNGRHAMLWWPSDLFQTGDQAVLAIQPKYNGDYSGGQPRRWLIHSSDIKHDYAGQTLKERNQI